MGEHILITTCNGDPNIGLFGFATDSYCLLGVEVPEELAQRIGEILAVPVHQLTIAGTSLVGAFLAGNEQCLLVPGIAFKNELAQLDAIGMPYKVVDTRLTALGNNILCNDTCAWVHPEMNDDDVAAIAEALQTKVTRERIAELPTVGSCAVMTDKGGVVHRDASDDELDDLKDAFGIEFERATVNLGTPFVHSGILSNNKGVVIGSHSGGPEVTNVDESLGFLQ